MRFATFFALVGASLGGLASALPADIEGQLQSPNSELSVLGVQALDLKVAREPSRNGVCPATNNGPGRVYPQQTYTVNQIKAAFLGGAKLAAAGKQVGDQHYPHDFNNAEKLPFDCGRDKMEFPIQTSNEVYNGGSVANVPDRVVFEYQRTTRDFIVKYCGVMRHGPTPAFLNCP